MSILDSLFSGELIINAGNIIWPLFIFAIGMTIYAIVVFKFYRFISVRNVFRLSEGGGDSPFHKVAYALEYLFLFPIIAFVWFFMISILLGLLSPKLVISNIFMVAMATLATIRLTAYYSEELSRDVAKIVPFGLLAIFILDIERLSIEIPIQIYNQFVISAHTLVYYFAFIVLLEVIIRLYSDWRGEKQKTKKEIEDSLRFGKRGAWSDVD